jgi:hypothetical protein
MADVADVAAGEWGAARQRPVRRGFFEGRPSDEVSGDPVGVGPAGNSLDHQAQQAEPGAGAFEASVRIEHWVRLQVGTISKPQPTEQLSGVRTVADNAGAVRQPLRQRHRGDVGIQAGDIGPDLIVQPQFLLLAQQHYAAGGETLRMRDDAEPVARGQRLPSCRIGQPEGVVRHDPALMDDGDDSAGLQGNAHCNSSPLGM